MSYELLEFPTGTAEIFFKKNRQKASHQVLKEGTFTNISILR